MKFMKRKIAVVLLVLFACTGMAMAQQRRTYTCKGYNSSCTNKVSASGVLCSSCAAAKKESETALNYYKKKQKDTCTPENKTNGEVTPQEWEDLNCSDYLNNKK